VALQRAVAGDGVPQLTGRTPAVQQRRQVTGQRALVVVRDHVLDEAPHPLRLPCGVQPGAADQLPDLLGHHAPASRGPTADPADTADTADTADMAQTVGLRTDTHQGRSPTCGQPWRANG